MKYEVLVTQGQGSYVEEVYNTLEEALNHVKEDWGGGSFAVKKPDGTYYDFSNWKLPKVTLLRLRKDIVLNPRQEIILEGCKKDREVWQMLKRLSYGSRLMGDLTGYNPHITKTLMELISWGFIELVESWPWSSPNDEMEYSQKIADWM